MTGVSLHRLTRFIPIHQPPRSSLLRISLHLNSRPTMNPIRANHQISSKLTSILTPHHDLIPFMLNLYNFLLKQDPRLILQLLIKTCQKPPPLTDTTLISQPVSISPALPSPTTTTKSRTSVGKKSGEHSLLLHQPGPLITGHQSPITPPHKSLLHLRNKIVFHAREHTKLI